MSTSGALTRLYDLQPGEGIRPSAALVQAADGHLYGTTSGPGVPGLNPPSGGSLFRISLDGAFELLHAFSGNDGA